MGSNKEEQEGSQNEEEVNEDEQEEMEAEVEEKPAEEKKPKKPKKNFDMLLNALQEKERQEVKTKAIQQLLE